MSRRTSGAPHRRASHDDDRGAALVELAFVSVILFSLLFGIIAFGFLLAFKQSVTQAAAEGARVGAVTIDDPSTTGPGQDERENAANAAVDEAAASFDQACTPGGSGLAMECTVTLHDCGDPLLLDDPNVEPDCITVEVDYDYDNFPILPDFPIIASFLPNTVSASSTAQVNP